MPPTPAPRRADPLAAPPDPRAPADLTPERAALRDAALAQLTQWGDPILRSPTTPVTDFGPALRRQVERMGELMDAAVGAGLAAPQVGSAQRLFVYRLSESGPPQALVNPRLVAASEERQLGTEGCLSIPFVLVEVERALAVTLAGQDLDGSERTVSAEGPDAVVLQHELDHLDGVLMLDRAAPAERRRAMRTLREHARG